MSRNKLSRQGIINFYLDEKGYTRWPKRVFKLSDDDLAKIGLMDNMGAYLGKFLPFNNSIITFLARSLLSPLCTFNLFFKLPKYPSRELVVFGILSSGYF